MDLSERKQEFYQKLSKINTEIKQLETALEERRVMKFKLEGAVEAMDILIESNPNVTEDNTQNEPTE